MQYKNYSNGDMYFGYMRDNHMEGMGALMRPEKYLFIGKIKDKKPNGCGIYVKKDNTII